MNFALIIFLWVITKQLIKLVLVPTFYLRKPEAQRREVIFPVLGIW
jgi:hypothetical protein